MGVVLSAGAGGGGEDCHVCCLWQSVSRPQPPPEPSAAHAYPHRGATLCLPTLSLHRQTKAPHQGPHFALASRNYPWPQLQLALRCRSALALHLEIHAAGRKRRRRRRFDVRMANTWLSVCYEMVCGAAYINFLIGLVLYVWKWLVVAQRQIFFFFFFFTTYGNVGVNYVFGKVVCGGSGATVVLLLGTCIAS